MKPFAGKTTLYTFFLFLWLLALFIVFRSFFLSGGDLIIGDLADGQLIQSIHEHWFLVFSGQEEWRNLNIFYPVKDTLGYSDTFFLHGIPYSFFRSMGLDMFVSFELVHMLLASIGFIGMLVWLRKYRGIHPVLAGWGAFIFACASPFYLGIRNSHIQLLAIWLLPSILVFFEASLRNLHQPGKRLVLSFTFFALLYGGLAYSTFYAAFFLVLGLIIALLSAIFIYGPKTTFKTIWPTLAGWKCLIPGLIVLGVWAGLFLWTYLPVRQDMGGRSLASVLESVPVLWHVFNHSETNLIWGGLGKLIWEYPNSHGWSFELSLPVLCFFFVLFTSIQIVRQRNEWKHSRPDILLSGSVVLISLFLMVRVGPVSPWAIPYYLLPGADVVRVVPRYNLALLIPVIFLISHFLESIWRQRSAMTRFMVVAFAVLMGLEQVQLVENSNISRKERDSVLSLAKEIPTDAEAFYAIGKPHLGWNPFVPHNTAMYLSKAWRIPTLNGRSGFLAKDWDLFDMNDPSATYPEILNWADSKGIQNRIYLYNIDNGDWIRCFDFSATAEDFSVNDDLMSLPAVEFSKLATEGWSGQEHWGVWSNKPAASVQFPGMEFSSDNQELVLRLMGFVNERQPQYEVSILLDGKEILRPRFTREKPELRFRVPVRLKKSEPWRLEFRVVPYRTPQPFILGVGLMSLKIEE